MALAKLASSFSLLILISIILSLSPSFARIPKTITTDESTLVALRNHLLATNPHHHVLASNWTTTTSICSWTGVICGTRHHRVTALNISDMGLSATVPSLLGNLSFLVSLDMSYNGFHGELPVELSRLHRLRAIGLRNNTFTGSFPPVLLNISTLENLTLSCNQLQGTLPQQIGNLTHLKVFFASYNMFGGAVPTGIGYLRMLEVLVFNNNRLQGRIPEEISNLYKLKVVQMSYNNLSGSIPAGIFNLSALDGIYMGYNKLTGSLPSNAGHALPDLETLHLAFNALTGHIPDSISNSSKLNQISLEVNHFTGPIPNSLGNLRSLGCLHLHGNKLTNSAPNQELSFITSLTNCPNLLDFSVSGNPLSGFLPTSIGNLSSSVTRIYASGCRINGEIPAEIGNLTQILMLKLADNALSGFLPNAFHGSQKLQGLFLENNRIRGGIPSGVCQLAGLSTLDLTLNQISGPIPDCIGSMSSLREIFLSFNTLNSSIPSTLWNLKDLLILNLSSNSFTGDLSPQVQDLKVAFLIDLSRNGFTGAIPSTSDSSKLQSLITFSLASNRLQGSIPESFGNMISLEWLDLSNNDLSGEIPKTLQELTSLKHFNVSFNRLRGEIPSGGPFKNFNSQFFESNEALCGDPRLNVPPCSRKSRGKRMLIVTVVVSVAAGGSFTLAMIILMTWIIRRRQAPLYGVDHHLSDHQIPERFSYNQIHLATDGFTEANLLGIGSFGSVYRATFEKGLVVAVKVFNLEVEHASKSFETECHMLSSLRHRNLTRVISACSNLDFKALLLEYMHNGSLEKWLHTDGYYLDMMQRLDIMIDVASALEYLHQGYLKSPVIHCDLKPSNILLDREMVGRVTDFGITKLLGDDQSVVHTRTLATLGYMAPEYGSGGVVSSACDVYSFGIVLMETFTGRSPTNDMFGEVRSLRGWIRASSLDGVVDGEMMSSEGDEEEHFNVKMEGVSCIMELAMDCSVESPKERMKMKDVVVGLNKIRLNLISIINS